MSTIGERLKEERLRLGYSQTKFGKLGDVTKNSQISYENNTRYPDALYFQAINDAGVDINYIITGIRTTQNVERRLHEMLTSLKNDFDSRIEKVIAQTQSEQQ